MYAGVLPTRHEQRNRLDLVAPCTRGFTRILRRHYGTDVATATELHRNDWGRPHLNPVV